MTSAPSKKVHFSCRSGCGKCCNSAPEMAISEGLRLYRDFILGIKISGARFRSGFIDASSRKRCDHLLANGGVEIVRGDEIIVYILNAVALEPSSRKRCSKLSPDMSCSIYDRRPNVCGGAPLDFFLPEDQMSIALDRAWPKTWKCDFSDAAPLLWADGRIAAGPYRDSYMAGLKATQLDKSIARFICGDDLQISYDRIADAFADNQHIIIDMSSTLFFLNSIRHNRTGLDGPDWDFWCSADIPSEVSFFEAQMSLIKDQINDNLSRKNADDRQNTAELRQMYKIYGLYLEELASGEFKNS